MREGALVGRVEGMELGSIVGTFVGRAVRKTPGISGEEVDGAEVVGEAVGRVEGCRVGCLLG